MNIKLEGHKVRESRHSPQLTNAGNIGPAGRGHAAGHRAGISQVGARTGRALPGHPCVAQHLPGAGDEVMETVYCNPHPTSLQL